MPTELLPGQTLVTLSNGVMRIDGFDVIIEILNILVGQYTQHVLHISNYDIPLDRGHIRIYAE